MGKDFLKRYEGTLNVLGPVFIGSGRELTKREWILDRKKRTGYILDELKLFNYLRQRKLLQSFEAYMLKDKRDLYGWAKENGIYPEDIGLISSYTLDCDGVADLNTIKGVQLFIKDGYGLPYVPGSSIKGAFRNVILAMLLNEKPDISLFDEIVKSAKKQGTRGAKEYLRKEADKLNRTYLHTLERPGTETGNAVNDMMSGVRVSDSQPLQHSDLIVCQKVDAHVCGGEKNMPIYRECLKPGTTVRFTLTLDETVTNLTVNDIENAISSFLMNYNRVFLSKFEEEQQYDGQVIYIGGGAGYHTKTVTGSILEDNRDSVGIISNIIDNTLGRKSRNEHGHSKDEQFGVSPHIAKLTEYDRGLYQFGSCEVKFREI